MEQFNRIAQALLSALGFSATHNEARMKVLCRGTDTDAGEAILILEVRIRKRSAPVSNNETKRHVGRKKTQSMPSKERNTKQAMQSSSSVGSLMQEVVSQARLQDFEKD